MSIGGHGLDAMKESHMRKDDHFMGCLKYPIGIAVAQEPLNDKQKMTADSKDDQNTDTERSGGGPLLYVCDGENTRIVVFDAITGEAIRTIRNGDDVGVVNFVKTINITSKGIVYIHEFKSYLICILSANRFLHTLHFSLFN